MELPKELNPVLAKIKGINDLGASNWWEVVYYDDEADEWCSFEGSDTFEDGETVEWWIYCHEVEAIAHSKKERK